MKATVKVNEQLSIDVEAEDVKKLFEGLANVQEVFGDNKCGACKSTEIRCCVRTVEDNSFYELVCNKCHCKVAFGHNKTGGGMYPKRYQTDSKGKAVKDKTTGKPIYLENNGWTKYVPKED